MNSDSSPLSKTNMKEVERPPNKLKDASFLSKILFLWPYEMIKTGSERPLVESDLPGLLEVDSSVYNLHLMNRIWEQEKERVDAINKKNQSNSNSSSRKTLKPNLHRAIVVDFFKSMWLVQIQTGLSLSAQIGQSLSLGYLIEFFNQGGDKAELGYFWAGMIVLCGLVVLLSNHTLFFATWRKGMQYRIAAIAAIFSKSLRLSSIGGINSTPSGRVVNLATNDVDRFLLACVMGSYLFWGPLQALAVLVTGLQIIGPAFAAGFSILFVFVCLQFYLGKQFAALRSKVAAITDKRVTMVSQAVSGARVMKMSGWEWQFNERIAKIRRLEIAQIQRANRLKAWNETIFFCCSVIVSLVIFSIHVGTGGVLTPRNVFTTMSLVNVVQFTLTKFVSLAVMGVSECSVSITRIQNFFEFPDLPPSQGQEGNGEANETDAKKVTCIAIANLTCHWNSRETPEKDVSTKDSVEERSNTDTEEDSSFMSDRALHDVNLELRMGELCCLIGTVGSGKSTLLQAISGELPPSSGSIERHHSSLAYAAQDPWVMNGTIRQNITLGLPFDEKWYSDVVSACGLEDDFTQFRNGDGTVVGDRGIQCSGGQRARIGLARALYRDADVLLLDDPLSAVDSKVGRVIFYEGIMGLAVKRGKCVVLATHQHQFIGEERCVLVSQGKVVCSGSYADCVASSGGKLSMAIQDDEDVAKEENQEQKVTAVTKQAETDGPTSKGGTSTGSKEEEMANKEMTNVGEVSLSTYVNYAKAMGGVSVGVGLFFLFAATQVSVLLAIAFFGEWGEKPADEQRNQSSFAIAFGLGILVFVLSATRALATLFLAIKASRCLHDRMTKAVLRAKVVFFDTNPVGRILNRFSADVGSNDDMLPQVLYDFFMCAFIVLGGVATAFSVLPIILVALPFLVFYFVRVRSTFLKTSRELKRLEGMARSPIFAMLSESLSGIATIRANSASGFFQRKFEKTHDAHGRAFFQFIATSRWLGFRMDSMMWMLLVLSSFLAVLFHDQGWFNVDPAILGLALTMLLQIGSTFQWSVRQSAEFVNNMVSVERVLAFGELSPEADLSTRGDTQLEEDWPTVGTINADKIACRYRNDLPLSLNGVSFRVDGGQRIGVVGRTGSGKSTLVQALFRLLEAEEGSIQVDGIDISKLGLHKLRMEMSVIPQTPVLFSGASVRENLDPFSEHNDTGLRDALADVQMLDVIEEMPKQLDSVVAEDGGNFSVGQRQLLCLARAILRKKKILVLDEPTANVDKLTDEALQRAVRKSFQGSTIIAVAHRLDTIIDYDRILVMGKGKVLEFGSPQELLSDSSSHFSAMVSDTGDQMSAELRRRAFGVKSPDTSTS